MSRTLIIAIMVGCVACAEPDQPAERDDARLTGDMDRYTRLSELPRHYRGTFEWDDGHRVQAVEIWFERVSPEEDGRTWIAEGRGVYRTTSVTNIDLRARMRPETGDFRMWESNPDTASFVTEGYHDGEISDDFGRIEARWHGHDDQQGTLLLNAVRKE